MDRTAVRAFAAGTFGAALAYLIDPSPAWWEVGLIVAVVLLVIPSP